MSGVSRRFAGRDPLKNSDTKSQYHFLGSRPLNMLDKLGLISIHAENASLRIVGDPTDCAAQQEMLI